MDAAAGAPPVEIARWRSCNAGEAEPTADPAAGCGDRDGDGDGESQLGPSASRQSLFAAAGFESGGDGGVSSPATSDPDLGSVQHSEYDCVAVKRSEAEVRSRAQCDDIGSRAT